MCRVRPQAATGKQKRDISFPVVVVSEMLEQECREDEAGAPALQRLWSQESAVAAEVIARSQSMALQRLLA